MWTVIVDSVWIHARFNIPHRRFYVRNFRCAVAVKIIVQWWSTCGLQKDKMTFEWNWFYRSTNIRIWSDRTIEIPRFFFTGGIGSSRDGEMFENTEWWLWWWWLMTAVGLIGVEFSSLSRDIELPASDNGSISAFIGLVLMECRFVWLCGLWAVMAVSLNPYKWFGAREPWLVFGLCRLPSPLSSFQDTSASPLMRNSSAVRNSDANCSYYNPKYQRRNYFIRIWGLFHNRNFNTYVFNVDFPSIHKLNQTSNVLEFTILHDNDGILIRIAIR